VYALARPLLFRLSPHAAHAVATMALSPLEYVPPLRALARALFRPRDPRLASKVLGIDFPGPVGLAGGFDKNALRPRALAALGFGHLELGTVTARPQASNPLPNLFRLQRDRALVNRLGFPNEGAERVVHRIDARKVSAFVPVGVSIGKSRDVPLEPLEPVIADYIESLRAALTVASFVVVNVSSPNTKNLRAMQGASLARALLSAVVLANRASARPRPMLVKIAPDLSDAELEALLAVVEEVGLDGVVATNTTIARQSLKTSAHDVDAIGAGGLSGPPLRARALEVVTRVRARLGTSVAVIGVGGIERGEHALAMLRAGADLVQLYTGMIYEGPLVAWSIHRELSRAMDREGASSLAELAQR
jgi:dihydroorotate dehydrogenase